MGASCLKDKLLDQLLSQVSLADYTSWQVGGYAEYLYLPSSIENLAELLKSRPPTEPFTWLGLGSNVLIRAGGILGLVIVTHPGLTHLGWEKDGVLRVEAGVPCPKVARVCIKQGWIGAEFLAGIPGTFGGALAMNAGAFGGETWNLVHTVETVSRLGINRTREAKDFSIGYRSVAGPPDEWFVAGTLFLKKGDTVTGALRIKEMLTHRAKTQPIHLPNCGSVFRNPPGDFAARLIETAGLKGLREGNAMVSEKHANFIVNLGNASAHDIENLIQKVKERVQKFHGIDLMMEVKILGHA